MKILLLILIISSTFLLSCKSEAEKEKEKQQLRKNELDDAILKAQQSPVLFDTIFLGFKFGMTEKQVISHLNDLKKTKKVYIDTYDNYKYRLRDKYNIEYALGFIAEYYDDKLFRMIFPIENSLGNDNCYVMVFSVFKEAKPNYNWYIRKDILGDTEYTSISNNLVVTFRKYGSGSAMIYENAPISKLAEEEKEKEQKEKFKNTLSEF